MPVEGEALATVELVAQAVGVPPVLVAVAWGAAVVQAKAHTADSG